VRDFDPVFVCLGSKAALGPCLPESGHGWAIYGLEGIVSKRKDFLARWSR
jgi:hypothetical protein